MFLIFENPQALCFTFKMDPGNVRKVGGSLLPPLLQRVKTGRDQYTSSYLYQSGVLRVCGRAPVFGWTGNAHLRCDPESAGTTKINSDVFAEWMCATAGRNLSAGGINRQDSSRANQTLIRYLQPWVADWPHDWLVEKTVSFTSRILYYNWRSD